MPSVAHRKWTGQGTKAMSYLRATHSAVRNTESARRPTAQQITYAFAVLLMAQFQGFCRDLHTEAVDTLAALMRPPDLGPVLGTSLMTARALDRGNPTPGNIGADFDRLGLRFWPAVYQHDSRNLRRREKLDALSLWRNAISHADFAAKGLVGQALMMDMVERWFRACHGLARSFDIVVRDQLRALTNETPW